MLMPPRIIWKLHTQGVDVQMRGGWGDSIGSQDPNSTCAHHNQSFTQIKFPLLSHWNKIHKQTSSKLSRKEYIDSYTPILKTFQFK